MHFDLNVMFKGVTANQAHGQHVFAKVMVEPDGERHTLPDGSCVIKSDEGAIVFCRFASGIGVRRYENMVLLQRPGHDFVVNISNKAWMQWD